MHKNHRSLDVNKKILHSACAKLTKKNYIESSHPKYFLINLKACRAAAKQLNPQIVIAEQQQKSLNGPSMGGIAERRG
jgi:hypothetical protein